MDARTFDKSKLVSRHVTEGPERAPNRSCLDAMSLTGDEGHPSFAGLATSRNEAEPCSIVLNRQAPAVMHGVQEDIGLDREFTANTVAYRIGHVGTSDLAVCRIAPIRSGSVILSSVRMDAVTCAGGRDNRHCCIDC